MREFGPDNAFSIFKTPYVVFNPVEAMPPLERLYRTAMRFLFRVSSFAEAK
jgi:hypothetical protein